MANPWRDLDVQAVADQPGSFTASISEPWMLAVLPQGGVVAAMAARAMAAVLDQPSQVLRSIQVVFAGQVAAGPVEIEVTVLRRGRSMSQLTATVRNPGAVAGLTALAVFGATRRGFAFTELAFPDHLPGPDGLRSYRDPIPEGVEWDGRSMPFWERIVECRPVFGGPPWEPQEPATGEAAYWYRLDQPPRVADQRLDPLACLVVLDTMPGAVFQRLGNGVADWYGPSADLTVHLFNPSRPGWLLGHNHVRHAGEGYASVEMALWDPHGPTLVAYATQMMFFTFGL